jgi:regulator of nucleoside diphosphate kinase
MKPAIIISALQADRLEAIADQLPASQMQGRQALLEELGRAQIVESGQLPAGVVAVNSTVRFAIIEPYEEFCMTLAYPADMHEGSDQISVLTPVGMALLGLREGSQIEWPRPNGQTVTVQVIEVLSHARPDVNA